jgi:hypothetical protein
MASSTIFVTFRSDYDAELALAEYKLIGTLVSPLLCRYTIEIPIGKEQEYVNLFIGNAHVKEVRECCIYGKERKHEPRNKANHSRS